MTDRQSLEADLARYRESGDFAAQAETLMALAEIANTDDDDDDPSKLVLGLYGQAYAAAHQASDKARMASALHKIANLMIELTEREETPYVEFGRPQAIQMYELALALYIDLADFRKQAEIYYELAYRANNTEQHRTAFLKALACYEALDDKPEQARTLMSIAFSYSVSDIARYSSMERAALLYQQTADIAMEAYVYYEMGKSRHLEKDYEKARTAFELAQRMCIGLQNDQFLAAILEEFGKTILELEGYQAYLHHHAYSLNLLYSSTKRKDYIIRNLVFELPQVACSNGDFASARQGYLSALSYVVACNQATLQAELYWAWSIMEYEQLKRYEMAIALCQRAVTLSKLYYPDYLSMFQQKFDEMRYKLASSQNPPNNP